MSDSSDDAIMVYLRRFDAKLDQVVEIVPDHSRRLTALEIAIGNLVASETNHYAITSLRIDAMDARLERIERRLDPQSV